LKAEIEELEVENSAKKDKLLEQNSRVRGQGWREEEEEEVELNYDDSCVKRYECESVKLRMTQADLSRGVGGLAPIENATYHDTNLKRIYSMSFRSCGKLVAAAGHQGMAGDMCARGCVSCAYKYVRACQCVRVCTRVHVCMRVLCVLHVY